MFLTLFGLRKKKERPWGVVYDALTKQPLANGVVRLLSGEGRLFGFEVTDRLGAFSFLPPEGSYVLAVQRHRYDFPTKLVSGDRDGEYENIYRGGEIRIESGRPLVDQSVPLTPKSLGPPAAGGCSLEGRDFP